MSKWKGKCVGGVWRARKRARERITYCTCTCALYALVVVVVVGSVTRAFCLHAQLLQRCRSAAASASLLRLLSRCCCHGNANANFQCSVVFFFWNITKFSWLLIGIVFWQLMKQHMAAAYTRISTLSLFVSPCCCYSAVHKYMLDLQLILLIPLIILNILQLVERKKNHVYFLCVY